MILLKSSLLRQKLNSRFIRRKIKIDVDKDSNVRYLCFIEHENRILTTELVEFKDGSNSWDYSDYDVALTEVDLDRWDALYKDKFLSQNIHKCFSK